MSSRGPRTERVDVPEGPRRWGRSAGLVGRGLRGLVFPVLAAAVVALVLGIGMFPARAYLEQKDEITDAQAELSELTGANAKAGEQLSRLNTDSEIEKVAREQYGLVKPGEEVYHVMPAPQDPVAVPDQWPFDGMRQKMKARPPATTDPAAAGAPQVTAPVTTAPVTTTPVTTAPVTTIRAKSQPRR